MHSSRMRAAHTVTIWQWCFLSRGVSPCQGGLPARGVPCDLSHHAFDVACMLPPHQLRPTNCAAAYIVWPRCMLEYHPTPSVDRITDTCKNITLSQTSFAGGNY